MCLCVCCVCVCVCVCVFLRVCVSVRSLLLLPSRPLGEVFDRQASVRRSLINTDTVSRRPKKVKRRKTISGLPDNFALDLGMDLWRACVLGLPLALPLSVPLCVCLQTLLLSAASPSRRSESLPLTDLHHFIIIIINCIPLQDFFLANYGFEFFLPSGGLEWGVSLIYGLCRPLRAYF